MAVSPAATPTALACRWTGRLLGAVLGGLVIAQFAGYTSPIRFAAPSPGSIQQTAWVVAVMGLAVGWLWDGAGALMVLGGMAAFATLTYSLTRVLPEGGYILVWVVGFLYLAAALLSARRRA
jgi:hypothetical protein